MTEHRPALADAPVALVEGRESEPVDSQHRDVTLGIERRQRGFEAAAVGGVDPDVALPCDDVRVGHDEVVGDHEARPLLDPVARDPLHLDHRRRDVPGRGGGDPARRWRPRVRRRERVEHFGERLVPDEATQCLGLGRRLRCVAVDRGGRSPIRGGTGRPAGSVRERGDEEPQEHEHADHTDDRARELVAPTNDVTRTRETAVQQATQGEPECLSDGCGHEHERE